LVRTDAHLRSTQAVSGYCIQASDGVTGHVCDFMMNPQSWLIEQLVAKTGHRFSGREGLIPTSLVERISYDQSTVFVKLVRAAVEHSPEFPARKKSSAPPELITPFFNPISPL